MILWLTFSISGTVLEQYISLVTSKGKAWQRENLTYECVHWLMGSCMHTQLNSPSGRQQWGTAGRWSSLFLTASPGLHDPEHTQQVSYLCVADLPLMQHKIKTDDNINSTLDLDKIPSLCYPWSCITTKKHKRELFTLFIVMKLSHKFNTERRNNYSYQ